MCNLRVVFIEHPGAGGRIEAEQTLTAQQVDALTLTATGAVVVHTKLAVVTQEAHCVAQRHRVIKVALRLALGVRVVDLRMRKKQITPTCTSPIM